jgi:hypothetical protein
MEQFTDVNMMYNLGGDARNGRAGSLILRLI